MTDTTSRRQLLGLSAALGATAAFGGFIPATGHASGARDPRLIVIILRGALDGMNAVPPVGDADYAGLRQELAIGRSDAIALDSTFALHPSLVNFARQYKAGQATVIHACASPYRDRSHFDGQDVLESGFTQPGQASGWLNRMLLTLPNAQRVKPAGLSVGATTPLVLRGQAKVLGWEPDRFKPRDNDLAPRLLALYRQSDPLLANVLVEAIQTGRIASGGAMKGGDQSAETMVTLAQGAARLMAMPDGPRIAALSFDGWDTHAAEASRLTKLLGGLDGAMAAFETTLGPVWNDTAIVAITEFGRTAAVNGTEGTDHGTATAAYLAGGAIKGGRVIADWPGLKSNQLYQNRDLMPTTDLRAVLKGLMADLYGVPPAALSGGIFPGSDMMAPMQGLIA